MIVELKSVGCVINTETLNTYPILKNDNFKITHLDDIDEEWFMRLSDFDFATIDNILNEREKNV